MTWIGGVAMKGEAGIDMLVTILAVMSGAAYPANTVEAVHKAPSVDFMIDGSYRQGFIRVSFTDREGPREDAYTDCPEGPTLLSDGYLVYRGGNGAELCTNARGEREGTLDSLLRAPAESRDDLEQKLRAALAHLDGDYALAVKDADKIVASRNLLGTKPLYFAEAAEFSAFASNKRALWALGLGEVKPLRAGTLAILDRRGVRVRKAFPVREPAIEIRGMAQAVDSYKQVLCSAIEKRLAAARHASKVGVLLSGGVDSCLLAKLVCDIASGLGIQTIAYTAGLPDSPDMGYASDFAREFRIEHRMQPLNIDSVESYIPKVVEAAEDSDSVQVETGIGLYAALEMASRDGISVLFSGQGPDELWGGYGWYHRVLAKDGRQALCRRMRDDLNRADIETLDRENKIAESHGAELLFPYLDVGVVDLAMRVAPELKVLSEEDRLGKHPHRELALRMGIPAKYAYREKVAIQHGTGIHAILEEIAIRNGFNPEVVKRSGYKSRDITRERLGSSSRYGYRYSDKAVWQVPEHVQFFLHALAYKKGLLNWSLRDRIGQFLDKARVSPGFLP